MGHTAFMLTMAVIIPPPADPDPVQDPQRHRPRWPFLPSAPLAAMAPVFLLLVVGRVIQAIGTAIMMPLLMTTVLNLVPFEKRA